MNPKLVLFATCCLVSATLGIPLATATFLPDTLDVGVTHLTVPLAGDTYPEDTVVTPKATWHNFGTRSATNFQAWTILSDSTGELVYAKKVTVSSLSPGGSIQIGAFPPCTLGTAGEWTFRCSTYMAGDMVRANDTMSCRFFVLGEVGVVESPQPMPAGQRAAATIVRGVLVLGAVGSTQNTGHRAELLDAMGRKVLDLKSGANDVRGLSPGVYFVRAVGGKPSAATKVVLTE
jgi:hypothetical protein